jgi:hypothetical protein
VFSLSSVARRTSTTHARHRPTDLPTHRLTDGSFLLTLSLLLPFSLSLALLLCLSVPFCSCTQAYRRLLRDLATLRTHARSQTLERHHHPTKSYSGSNNRPYTCYFVSFACQHVATSCQLTTPVSTLSRSDVRWTRLISFSLSHVLLRCIKSWRVFTLSLVASRTATTRALHPHTD